MNKTETKPSLKIVKELNVPVELVFKAWTDAKQVVQWMGPGEVKCQDVQIDLKVGGKYRICMVSAEGDHVAYGQYKEIVPNKRLQYTWAWEKSEMPDTLVTVEFDSTGKGTRITLIHEGFPAQEAADKHTQGWTGCIEKLAQFLK